MGRRRHPSAILAGALCIVAAACTGGGGDTTVPGSAPAPPPTGTVAGPPPEAPTTTTMPPPVIPAGVWVGTPGSVVHVAPSGGVVAEVPLGEVRLSVAYGDGSIWAGDFRENVVHRIDPETAEVLATIDVPGTPGATAFSDGALWVAQFGEGTLARIDAVDNSATLGIPAGPEPNAVAAGSAYVGTLDGQEVVAYDTAGAERARVPMEDGVSELAVGGGSVWAALIGGIVLELDPESLETRSRLTVDGLVGDMAYGDGALWLALFGGDIVRAESGTSNVWASVEASDSLAYGDGNLFVVGRDGRVHRVGTAAPDDVTELAVLDGESFEIAYAPAHTADGTIVAAPVETTPPEPEEPVDLAIGEGWRRLPADEAVFGGPGPQTITALIHYEGGFVAAGFDGVGPNDRPVIWHSADGLAWSRADLSAGYDLRRPQRLTELVAGPGGLVAAGFEQRGCDRDLWSYTILDACEQTVAAIWQSPDGRVWTRVPHDANLFASGSSLGPGALAATGDQFVMLGREPSRTQPRLIVWTSPDGLAWSRSVGDEGTPVSPDDLVVATDGTLVALGYEYWNDWFCNSSFRPCRFWVSSVTTSMDDSLDGPPENGRASIIWTSADGSEWTRFRPVWENLPGGDFVPMLTPQGRLLTLGSLLVKPAGNGTYTSPDGITWTATPTEFGLRFITAAVLGGDGVVAATLATESARVWTAADGIAWRALATHDPDATGLGDRRVNALALGDGIWVMAGSDTDSGDRDAAVWVSQAGPWPPVPDVELTVIGPCRPGRDRTCTDLDVSGQDLAGLQAAGIVFERATMVGTNLSGADLRHADLSGANLFGANLSGARLGGANLSGADLRGADLSGADVRNPITGSRDGMSNADLRGADLTGAYLRGLDLTYADLRGAVLRDAVMVGAQLFRTRTEGADLAGADLSGANIDQEMRDVRAEAPNRPGDGLADGTLCELGPGAVCRDADLRRVELRGVDLPDADLHGSYLPSSSSLGTFGESLARVDLGGSYLRGFATGLGDDASGAIFSDAYLRGGSSFETDFSGADFSGSDLSSFSFSHSNLSSASFAGADLSYGTFQNSDLTGADFTGAELTGVIWTNSTCPDGTAAGSSYLTASCLDHLTP